MVEPSARFEEVKIPLSEPALGLEEVSGVLGVPRWWPTGGRVGVVLAHDASGSMADPLIEQLHRDLTELRYLTLRFNFPFAEAQRKRPDAVSVLRRTYRAALGALTRDPGAAPAHIFLGGMGLGAEVACDLDALRRTLLRVGAPTTLHICEEADHRFQVPKKSPRGPQDVQRELLATLDGWIQKILEPSG